VRRYLHPHLHVGPVGGAFLWQAVSLPDCIPVLQGHDDLQRRVDDVEILLI
jgi:hypothetical protein